MGRSKNTVYLEEHHEVYFDLVDPVKKTGAVRSGLDLWLEQRGVPANELEMAVQLIKQSDKQVEDVVDASNDVDEFIRKAKASVENTTKP